MVNVPYTLSKLNGGHGPGDRIAAIVAGTTINFDYFVVAAATATIGEHSEDAYKLSSRRIRLWGFSRDCESDDLSCLWGRGSNTRGDESAEDSNCGEFFEVMHYCVYSEFNAKIV